MFVSLDYEEDELQFRQEIWHKRMTLLFSEDKSARVPAENLRIWLEEGQELEVVSDPKYEKLSEAVEDLDNVARALKMCATVQEVDSLDKEEN